MAQRTVSYSLPERVIQMVETVQQARHDPTKSDTVRVLLLKALADLGYLKAREVNALMFAVPTVEKVASS